MPATGSASPRSVTQGGMNPNRLTANSVLGASSSVAPALGGESLVVVLAEVQAELSPSVKVALGGDGAAAGPLVLPVGDVLPEGALALDAGLVDLLVLPDVVDAAVARDAADLLALGAARTVAGVLLDVVLDERVGGPAVDGDEDRAGGGLGLALELDVAVGARAPALADYEVAGVGEVDRVAVVGRVELDVAAGLVVLVVVLAAGDDICGEVEIGKIDRRVSSRSCHDARGGRKGQSKSAESDHDEG